MQFQSSFETVENFSWTTHIDEKNTIIMKIGLNVNLVCFWKNKIRNVNEIWFLKIHRICIRFCLAIRFARNRLFRSKIFSNILQFLMFIIFSTIFFFSQKKNENTHWFWIFDFVFVRQQFYENEFFFRLLLIARNNKFELNAYCCIKIQNLQKQSDTKWKFEFRNFFVDQWQRFIRVFNFSFIEFFDRVFFDLQYIETAHYEMQNLIRQKKSNDYQMWYKCTI